MFTYRFTARRKGALLLTIQTISKSVLLLICATVLSACGTAEVGKRYYLAQATVKKEMQTQQPDEIREETAAPGEILKNGTATVGFFPGNGCQSAASPTAPPAVANGVTAECAILLPILERKATEAGYTVVPWSRFGTNPWIAAKAMSIEVLFVVEGVTIQWSTPESYRISALAFAEQKDASRQETIEMGNVETVAQRCRSTFELYFPMDNLPAKVEGVTVDIQMLAAEDGSTQWQFKKSKRTPEQAPSVNTLYFQSTGTKKRGLGGGIVGAIFTAMGVGAVAAGSVYNVKGTTLTTRNVGAGVAWGSAILFGIGLPLGVVGLVRERRDPVYPSAEAVMCATDRVVRDPFGDQVAPAAPSPEDQQQLIVESTRLATTYLEELSTQFFAEVEKLRLESPVVLPDPYANEGDTQATEAEGEATRNDSDAKSAAKPDDERGTGKKGGAR